jgi:hypothetical protein
MTELPKELEARTRTKGEMCVIAWHEVVGGVFTETVDHFEGKTVANGFMDDGQPFSLPFDFPICNCSSWEEAWLTFAQARDIKWMQMQAEAKEKRQKIIQQQMHIERQRVIANAAGAVPKPTWPRVG